MNNKTILIFFLVIGSIQTWTVEEGPKTLPVEPIKIGNFENQEWPTASFGLGQFITPKKSIVPYPVLFHTKGKNQNQTIVYPQVGYGILDSLSLLVSLPIITNVNVGGSETQGVGDLLVQFEYAYYEKSTELFFNQATIVTNITFPTGHLSTTSKPSTGVGAVSLFFGATLSHTSADWYAYLSDGIIINTPAKNTQVGNNVLYEGGIGRNLGNPGGITLVGILEFNGVYIQKNKTNGEFDPNSGGNTIFLGPTICCSFKNVLLFGGMQFPVYQHLNGTQGKQKYRLIFNALATF
jgi:hypothetical protein